MPYLFAPDTLLECFIHHMYPVLDLDIAEVYFWILNICGCGFAIGHEVFIMLLKPYCDRWVFTYEKHLAEVNWHLRYSNCSQNDQDHVEEEQNETAPFLKQDRRNEYSTAALHMRIPQYNPSYSLYFEGLFKAYSLHAVGSVL